MRVDLSCFKFLDETRYVAVVRAIANIARFRFRPGVISVCGLSLLFGSRLVPWAFLWVIRFFPLCKNQHSKFLRKPAKADVATSLNIVINFYLFMLSNLTTQCTNTISGDFLMIYSAVTLPSMYRA